MTRGQPVSDPSGLRRLLLEGRLEYGLMLFDCRNDISYGTWCANGACPHRAIEGDEDHYCQQCREART